MEPLSFGQSHWDYLPVEIQEHILDLAARSIHRDRMKRVCSAIQNYAHWRDSCLFKNTFSQRWEKCYKIFSPELSMPRHRGLCEGPQILKEFAEMMEEDTRSYRSFDDGFKDRYGYFFMRVCCW